MIQAIEGPLIAHPLQWVIVFDPKAGNRWVQWLTPGRYKHVRAFGYVPFLHVWLFYDANLAGIEIVVAADGPSSRDMIAAWTAGCYCLMMPRVPHVGRSLTTAASGWCVPAVKRLIGLRCGALRPDALLADCLRNGGKPLNEHQRPSTSGGRDSGAAGTAPTLHATAC